MDTLSLIQRLACRAILRVDRHGVYTTECALHSHVETWPNERTARIAAEAEHVRDWCPCCACTPEPPSAA
jgi:hypothetical protein